MIPNPLVEISVTKKKQLTMESVSFKENSQCFQYLSSFKISLVVVGALHEISDQCLQICIIKNSPRDHIKTMASKIVTKSGGWECQSLVK